MTTPEKTPEEKARIAVSFAAYLYAGGVRSIPRDYPGEPLKDERQREAWMLASEYLDILTGKLGGDPSIGINIIPCEVILPEAA